MGHDLVHITRNYQDTEKKEHIEDNSEALQKVCTTLPWNDNTQPQTRIKVNQKDFAYFWLYSLLILSETFCVLSFSLKC